MKKLIFGFTALALAVPTALLAQQAPEPKAQGEHGRMACCQKDKDGKMQCPMMDHSQMDQGQMDHGQMGGEGMTRGASGDHSARAHCGMMGGNSDKPATGHDDHDHHQGHTPQ
ncbi:hypothetical protein [Novosphingobium album (ex Liu et al. 2023)]|uniref:Copper resistance protein CopB n=1 Tax=Novosphingobium album (ex Liu et al. 2023) TaxID=3031130 RepID=A0ABT5WV89_9SPHN|nr:hypothetical protein [Novosphingobium album (ex Liu et al. 2023)]MDE8653802.1 hypothetical protein [Novosphingobium album (ex Liu et al. 2023)]